MSLSKGVSRIPRAPQVAGRKLCWFPKPDISEASSQRCTSHSGTQTSRSLGRNSGPMDGPYRASPCWEGIFGKTCLSYLCECSPFIPVVEGAVQLVFSLFSENFFPHVAVDLKSPRKEVSSGSSYSPILDTVPCTQGCFSSCEKQAWVRIPCISVN